MRKILAVLCSVWLLAACLPTVAGVAAYKIAQNKTQNSYREYVTQMEKTNLERREKGLEPLPIRTFTEWKQMQ